jgi:antitoxin (DNA-binding transcriptional repressor) of toxin-antitoxin stability system
MTKRILASNFKARCLTELKEVQRTGQSLIVILDGRPLARVEPIPANDRPKVKLGSRPGNASIKSDLIKTDFTREWEMES